MVLLVPVIEFPVVLVRLREPDVGAADMPRLEVVDEFHTYIKPKLIPTLTDFCKTLTGISQSQVDQAQGFQAVVWDLFNWLLSHSLIDTPDDVEDISQYAISCKGQWGENAWHPISQSSLTKDTAWVTHGPHDLLSFIPKAAWINGLLFGPPKFLRGPILDIRKTVHGYLGRYIPKPRPPRDDSDGKKQHPRDGKPKDGKRDLAPDAAQNVAPSQTPLEQKPERGDGSIPGLLQSLGMSEFQGKLHCGLDDTRNIARILIEIGRLVFEGLTASDEQVDSVTEQTASLVVSPSSSHAPSRPNSSGSSSSNPATPRPASPPPTTIQLLQSLLQSNLTPYEYPPLPPILTEEQRRTMNIPGKSTLSESDQRLLKGGGRFYPRRYSWMGKKVGMVKLEGQAQK